MPKYTIRLFANILHPEVNDWELETNNDVTFQCGMGQEIKWVGAWKQEGMQITVSKPFKVSGKYTEGMGITLYISTTSR